HNTIAVGPATHQPQKIFVKITEPVSDGDEQSATDAEGGEHVGSDPCRHVCAKPVQRRPLQRAEKNIVHAGVGFLGCGLYDASYLCGIHGVMRQPHSAGGAREGPTALSAGRAGGYSSRSTVPPARR